MSKISQIQVENDEQKAEAKKVMETAATTMEQMEEKVVIRAKVKNDGCVDTQDVVQVYVHNEGSENAPRNPRLCGFVRVNCPAGSETDAVIEIEKKRLLVVNDLGKLVSEGKPVFYVGVSQPDARSLALTGHACIKITL